MDRPLTNTALIVIPVHEICKTDSVPHSLGINMDKTGLTIAGPSPEEALALLSAVPPKVQLDRVLDHGIKLHLAILPQSACDVVS